MSKGGGSNNYYPLPTVQQSNTSKSEETKIPEWLTNASQFGVNNAKSIINAGTPQYNAPLAAGLTGDQLAAGDMLKDTLGYAQPYYNQAQGAIDTSMQAITPATLAQGLSGIGAYMNPYTQNVVDSLKAQSDQNLAHSLSQTADQAIAAKAFGGSRHGVQEGVATAQNNLGLSGQIANLLQSGYNQATSLLGNDVSTQNAIAQQNRANALNGANALGSLGTAAQNANTSDVNNLMAYGALGQQTAQNALDKYYNLWQFQSQYPLQAQQVYNQTVSSAPHNTSGTMNASTNSIGWAPQQQETTSPLAAGLGGAAVLGSGLGKDGWLTNLGLAGGKLAGFAGPLAWGGAALSDETEKTDIKKLGKDDETGLDIYAYRYKGDPKDYPKIVGPMAQDVEKHYPDATRRVAGKLTVDFGALNSLAGKFAGMGGTARGLLA